MWFMTYEAETSIHTSSFTVSRQSCQGHNLGLEKVPKPFEHIQLFFWSVVSFKLNTDLANSQTFIILMHPAQDFAYSVNIYVSNSNCLLK